MVSGIFDGGRLAAAAYLKYPEKYSGLVLVSANIEPLSKAERIQRKTMTGNGPN